MKSVFESNIVKKHLFTKKDKLLLAISAGSDSTVLAHLLKECGYSFSMAHCNFNLRGADSIADETFCCKLAGELKVELFVNSFNTKQYLKEHKLSIQMAARELRYNWFKQLREQHGFTYILTAHHTGDVAETQLINLIRGTGIKGLTGIAEKRNELVRPLLQFSKKQIEDFAEKNRIKYRLDKSNSDDKYERNFIRLKILPLLKKINPQIEETFMANAHRFAGEAALLKEILEQKKQQFYTQSTKGCTIDLQKLITDLNHQTILFYLIHPFGFNQTQSLNICNNGLNGSGQVFFSPTHKATINRSVLIIEETTAAASQKEMVINSLAELKKHNLFKVQEQTIIKRTTKNELLILPGQLRFPLTVRPKKNGDKFMPFGLKHYKLLSDFFREEKMSAFEKENCLLLVNGNAEIIWVIGKRSDERYRLAPESTKHLKLSWHGE